MSLYPIRRHQLLHKTFVHLEGIGPKSERHLWRQGILTWDDLRSQAARIFPGKRLDPLLQAIDASMKAWDRGDLYYFCQALPGDERWRLIEGAHEDIAYFDIEATGGGMPTKVQSTAIAFLFRGTLYQEHDYRKKRDLIEWILDESPILCTYNGATYDVPFLSQEFLLPFHKAHIDLHPWYRRLGFEGGLKAIQKKLDFLPQRLSDGLDGYDAVRLWRMHEAGIPRALETLMTYNAEDVVILPDLLHFAYVAESAKRPHMQLDDLPKSIVPPLKGIIDPAIYDHLKNGLPLPEP